MKSSNAAGSTFVGSTGQTPSAPVPAGAGTVLRDVAVHREPRSLVRPGQGALEGRRDRAGTRTESREREEQSVPPEATPLYQQGYRAAWTEAEAAFEAKHDAAVQSGYRAGHERGLREGHETGLDEGREAGRQAVERDARAAQTATAARLNQLEQLISRFSEEYTQRLAAAQDDLVALCHEIVCRVLGDRLVTAEGVAHCVQQAIRESTGSVVAHGSGLGMVIQVHPRDLELLHGDPQLTAWLQQVQVDHALVRWVGDERVRLGGCIVSSAQGSLDARLETQLYALRDLLLKRLPGEPEEETRGAGARTSDATGAVHPVTAKEPLR